MHRSSLWCVDVEDALHTITLVSWIPLVSPTKVVRPQHKKVIHYTFNCFNWNVVEDGTSFLLIQKFGGAVFFNTSLQCNFHCWSGSWPQVSVGLTTWTQRRKASSVDCVRRGSRVGWRVPQETGSVEFLNNSCLKIRWFVPVMIPITLVTLFVGRKSLQTNPFGCNIFINDYQTLYLVYLEISILSLPLSWFLGVGQDNGHGRFLLVLGESFFFFFLPRP